MTINNKTLRVAGKGQAAAGPPMAAGFRPVFFLDRSRIWVYSHFIAML